MAALSVAGLTACGDKVNVTQPAPDSAVTAVNVTPSTVPMNVGDKVTLVATVVAGPQQTNRNVTWTSSDATVASVDNAGVVTANKGGVATIIATSAANPAIKGNAVITVAAVVQASVTIGQINQTVCDVFGSCTSVPAVLNNVANQLDVTLNVDQGTQKISEVDLIMNCGGADTVVQKQTFSTADVAPLAEDASAPTTLSFNTAAFNPTTGAVNFKNGVCTIKAKAITTQGTQVASGTQQLTLNNVDGVLVTTTNSGATAADANGLPWKSGNITVAATPVLYSGRTPATVSITLPGATTATQTLTASTTGATSATWSATASSGPRVKGLTLFAGFNGNGLQIPVHPTVLLIDSNGNDLNLGQLNPTSQSDVRVDNQAPPTAGVVFNPGLQSTTCAGLVCWLGANYTFSTASDASKPITVPTGAGSTSEDFHGVDKVTVQTQWAPIGTDPTQNTGWTTFTSITSLAETSTSNSYDLRLNVCDALNNCATTGTLATFGVDLTPPSATLVSGIADKKVFAIGATLPSTIAFAIVDTSKTAGVSGSGVGSGGLLVQDQGLKPDSSAATGSRTVCAIGTATGSGNAKTCKSPTQLAATFTLPAAAVTAGEYTLVVTPVDQAGNTAPAQTFTYYIDQNAPVVPASGVTIPNPINASSSFALAAGDSMDVKAGNGFLAIDGFGFFEAGTASPAGATFDNALVRQSTITVGLPVFYKSLQAAAGGTNPGAAGVLPAGLGVRAIDAAGNLSANQPIFFPPANLGTAGTISATDPSNGLKTWAIDSITPNPVDATKSVGVFVSGLAFNTTSGNPFVQVCLYYAEPTGAEGGAAGPDGAAAGELIKIGCSTAGATTGAGATRGFSYTFSWTPPSIFYGASATLYAVGNTSALDALITDGKVINVNALP